MRFGRWYHSERDTRRRKLDAEDINSTLNFKQFEYFKCSIEFPGTTLVFAEYHLPSEVLKEESDNKTIIH
jgi:hypothetical protein